MATKKTTQKKTAAKPAARKAVPLKVHNHAWELARLVAALRGGQQEDHVPQGSNALPELSPTREIREALHLLFQCEEMLCHPDEVEVIRGEAMLMSGYGTDDDDVDEALEKMGESSSMKQAVHYDKDGNPWVKLEDIPLIAVPSPRGGQIAKRESLWKQFEKERIRGNEDSWEIQEGRLRKSMAKMWIKEFRDFYRSGTSATTKKNRRRGAAKSRQKKAAKKPKKKTSGSERK